VAKWLAAKAFPLDGNRLREIQKSVNTTLADSSSTNAVSFSFACTTKRFPS
jgi:hypothetical protein